MKEKTERNEKKRFNPWPILRIFGSLVAIAIIGFLSVYAVKFCLSLFLRGDYFVKLPGFDSPVLYQSMEKDNPSLSQKETEPPEGVYEVSRATITLAGDLMMHMPIVRSGATDDGYNFDYIFTYVERYVSAADYAAANLETTLSGTDSGKEYTGHPHFNSPDAIVDGAASAGFDLLLTGNNHSYDYGTYGLKRTLDVIKSKGLDTLGSTNTADTPKYIIRDLDGIQVGMVCYTYGEIGSDSTSVNGLKLDSNANGLLNVFDYDKLDLFYSQMESHIAAMKKEGAEVILLYLHWGDDLTSKVSDDQKAIAQKMCDLGVDVIAGAHPHVVQTMDLLTSSVDPEKKTVCIYSMGNLLSNQRATNISLKTGHSEDGVLFTFNYARYSDGSLHMINCYVVPTWILVRGEGDGRKYQVLPLDKDLSDWRAVFELDAQQLADAQASFTRTTEIVAEGRKVIQDYLIAQTEAREAAWAAEAETE